MSLPNIKTNEELRAFVDAAYLNPASLRSLTKEDRAALAIRTSRWSERKDNRFEAKMAIVLRMMAYEAPEEEAEAAA